MSNWIKTDDLQYVKKIRNGVYKIAEARYAEDRYIVCRDKVIIANWLDSDGNYDSDCVEIIKVYYGSVDEFKEKWINSDMREQVLAEIIFEETPYDRTDKYELCTMEIVEDKLQEFLRWE